MTRTNYLLILDHNHAIETQDGLDLLVHNGVQGAVAVSEPQRHRTKNFVLMISERQAFWAKVESLGSQVSPIIKNGVTGCL